MFYEAVNRRRGTIDFGDVTDRIAIKNKRQVRSFEWFLNKFNISYPGKIKPFIGTKEELEASISGPIDRADAKSWL